MKITDKIKGMDISTLLEEEQCGAKYYDGGEAEDALDILARYGVNSVRLRLWNDPYGEAVSTSDYPDTAQVNGRPETAQVSGCPDTAQENSRPTDSHSVSGSTSASPRYKYGAGTNDLETVITLAKRAKAHGMSILLDFHYSDFWADPGKQYPPKAWAGHSPKQLVQAVYDYTYSTLVELKKHDIIPVMVQVGNELTNGCCWPLGNRHFGREGAERAELTRLVSEDGGRAEDAGRHEEGPAPYFNPILKDMLTAGIVAVREASPDSIIMLHLDNGGNNDLYRDWFDGYFACKGAGLWVGTEENRSARVPRAVITEAGSRSDDFDVIGLSYYPFWHGNFAALEHNLNDIAARYGKELVIAEVSMGHSMEDYRRYELPAGRKEQPEPARKAAGEANLFAQEEKAVADTLPESIDDLKGMATREALIQSLDYPMTPEGQASFMQHLNRIIEAVPGHLGRGYYYWEPAWIPVPGCGWATPASLEYIHDHGPCGNEWANQALFDYDGHVLPALKV